MTDKDQIIKDQIIKDEMVKIKETTSKCTELECEYELSDNATCYANDLINRLEETTCCCASIYNEKILKISWYCD